MEYVASDSAEEVPVNRLDVRDMMEEALNQLSDKHNVLLVEFTEELFIKLMEHNEEDHDMPFVSRALKRATNDMLMSMRDGDGVREISEAAIVQMSTSAPILQITTRTHIFVEKIMKLMVQFVANRRRKKWERWRRRMW